jgi:hypothetical protein
MHVGATRVKSHGRALMLDAVNENLKRSGATRLLNAILTSSSMRQVKL